jgi:MFS family permease
MTSTAQFLCDTGVARGAGLRGGPVHGRSALIASIAGCCLVFISSAVTNVALAGIGRNLGLDAHALQWVLNAELLPLAALSLVGGALGDRYGHKRLFLLGIGLFALASLGCATASAGGGLILARFVQGTAEALILPTGLTILGQAFPAEHKSWAVGLWSAAAAVACAAGPAIAGWILQSESWRAVYAAEAPLAGLALVVAWTLAPRSEGHAGTPIDLLGGALSVAGLGALGWALMSLTDTGSAPFAFEAGVCATVAAFVVLGLVEHRKGDRAMLPPAVFSGRTVVALSVFTGLLYGAFTVVITLVPFVMINGAHLGASLAGLALVPLQLLIGIVSPAARMLCARLGHSLPLAIGAVLTGLGCIAMLQIEVTASYWMHIFPAVVLVAAGMSLVMAPLTTLVMTSVGSAHAATATGFNGAISRAGSLAGVALLGNVLQLSGHALVLSFHVTMVGCALACLVAALATGAIDVSSEPDPDPVLGL